ncbi:DUF882 domain-containing protein [Rhodopseudomonas palustris]|uniref:Murein endopeptidase K n=1 Tax=Rhodopseudomonas palustris (strain BisB18) TaxID=316056 RepID=Q20ZD2_RHOPB
MLAGFARRFLTLTSTRAGVRAGLASLLLLAGAGSVHDATALGDTRTLSFHHTHSDENLTVTFKRNGRYDEAALREINHFLRDWRSQDQTTMDRRLFDILWEVYRDVDAKQPIQIISAYRSPATNAMLRRRSSGVARASQHMLGQAMDFYIPGVALEQIRFAGLRLQRGGVGFYPTSGSPFVHLDTGNIRHWPRMSHDQLARVFPNGRTVHVPSDGNPLPGYQLALADIEKRGGASDATGSGPTGFLASLFGKSKSGSDEDDEGGAAPAVVASADAASPAGLMAAAPGNIKNALVKIIDNVPLPRAKPPAVAAFQVASADVPPAPIAKPVAEKADTKQDPSKPQSPADIINARGFWDDMPATKQATPAQVAAISARQALAAADPQSTATISESTMQAMAYAPPPSERAQVVAASAPVPRSVRPAQPARNQMAINNVTTVVAKGQRGHGAVVATSSRLAAAAVKDNDVWMRAMILAPSASTMTSTVFGDTDLTILRAHFSKPQAAVAMAFADDPQSGMQCEQFTGAAVVTLSTTPFTRTAALR